MILLWNVCKLEQEMYNDRGAYSKSKALHMLSYSVQKPTQICCLKIYDPLQQQQQQQQKEGNRKGEPSSLTNLNCLNRFVQKLCVSKQRSGLTHLSQESKQGDRNSKSKYVKKRKKMRMKHNVGWTFSVFGPTNQLGFKYPASFLIINVQSLWKMNDNGKTYYKVWWLWKWMGLARMEKIITSSSNIWEC